MRPAHRLLCALVALVAWFGGVAERLAAALEAHGAERRIEPDALAIASAVMSARRSLLPRGERAREAAELLRGAAEEREIEATWTARAAAVLDPGQRADPGIPPPLPRLRHQPWLDPELPALLEALGAAHGHLLGPAPDVPAFDPWPGLEPRRRVAALRALAPSLHPTQAAAVSTLAWQAAQAAARRARAEQALRSLLDPAILRMAARSPGRSEDVGTAVALLRLRSG